MKNSTSAFFACISFAVGLAPIAASAKGPCTDQIADMGRQLGNRPGLGAPISEPSAGLASASKPGTPSKGAEMKPSDRSQPGGATLSSGGSAGTVGGTSGAAGADAGTRQAVASGQVATSSEDVRRQSVGKPTAAEQASLTNGKPGGPDEDMSQTDRTSEAKMALQKAVDLNAKGDKGCVAALDRVRSLLSKG